jgi:hypothetical protein
MRVPNNRRIKEFNKLISIKNEQFERKRQLLEELQEVDNNLQIADAKVKQWGMTEYKDKCERDEILKKAEECGFSQKTIDFVRLNEACWNDDEITASLIELFPKMEIRIKSSSPKENKAKALFKGICEWTDNIVSDRGDDNDT